MTATVNAILATCAGLAGVTAGAIAGYWGRGRVDRQEVAQATFEAATRKRAAWLAGTEAQRSEEELVQLRSSEHPTLPPEPTDGEAVPAPEDWVLNPPYNDPALEPRVLGEEDVPHCPDPECGAVMEWTGCACVVEDITDPGCPACEGEGGWWFCTHPIRDTYDRRLG